MLLPISSADELSNTPFGVYDQHIEANPKPSNKTVLKSFSCSVICLPFYLCSEYLMGLLRVRLSPLYLFCFSECLVKSNKKI